MLLLASVVVTTVVLLIVAAVLPGLEFDGVGSAFMTALVLRAAGWLSGYLLFLLPPEFGLAGLLFFGFVVTLIGLVVAAGVVTGMRLTGILAAIVAALLLQAVGYATSFLMAQLLHGSMPVF